MARRIDRMAVPAAPAASPRRSIDLQSLRSFTETVGSAVGPELILRPGKDLYHYTDLNGFLGILEHGDLWLTHSRFSNDEEEMAHGQRIVADAIKQASTRIPAKGGDAYAEYLKRLEELVTQPSNEGVYICCFCQKDNLLSQWRGYAANGSGVSLQFDSGGFSPRTGADCPHGLMRFWKVQYEEEKQRKVVDAAITLTFGERRGGRDATALAHLAADRIQFFIPTFKNGSFNEEAEWRLIFTPDPGCTIAPRFRVRGSMVVPYYSLRDLDTPPVAARRRRTAGSRRPATDPAPPKLPISHVTVGPSANKALNVESVRMLLQRRGYPTVSVEASKIPFRS
jgi:hypothetical protein